jgi:TolB-like protein
MQRRSPVRCRVAAIGALGFLATALSNSCDRGRSAAAKPGAPVIVIAWRSVGHDIEPWSGVGLGEQVRQALRARGVVHADSRTVPIIHSSSEPVALASLGREIDATYVLGGTVGRKGERSEVGMQLVRVHDGAPIWSSTFWRDPNDLASLAADLAATVDQVLEAELLGQSRDST